jgi:hypothetical protein
MKTFKLILNWVLPVLLVISIVLNIFLACRPESTEENEPADVVTETVQPDTPEKPKDRDKDKDRPTLDRDSNKYKDSQKHDSITYPSDKHNDESHCTREPNNKPEYKAEENVIYQDNNIKIIYLYTEEVASGLAHKFRLENTSSKTLTVLLTDIHIDGRKIFVSGLTCDKLLPHDSAVEDLILMSNEVVQSAKDPSDFSFVVKLVNEKSKLDLYESDRIGIYF